MAKTILALNAQQSRKRQMQERIAEDVQTGAISDGLADYILEFCKTNRNGVCGTDLERITLFFNEVRNSLTRLDWEGELPKKARESLSLEERFHVIRPKPSKDENSMAHLARWLALFLKSEAPERPILDHAVRVDGNSATA